MIWLVLNDSKLSLVFKNAIFSGSVVSALASGYTFWTHICVFRSLKEASFFKIREEIN